MEWLKSLLVSATVSNLSGLFDGVNQQVESIASQVGTPPQSWNGAIYNMIRAISDNVIVPIAGVILAFVMTLELIQMVSDKNNFHCDIDTWLFFRWIFKTACSTLIVTNTWNIVIGIFEAGQSVVNGAAGIIPARASIDIADFVTDLEDKLNDMEPGQLFGLWFQSQFVGLCTWIIAICVFVITFGRMIEIFLVTSIAPIPMATMVSKDFGNMGQNYLRSLLALAFQGFLIIICVAIYSSLVQNIAVSPDISYAIWTCMGYTVLLCFTLFKTGSVSRSIFSAN